jgi:hypothetical protein
MSTFSGVGPQQYVLFQLIKHSQVPLYSLECYEKSGFKGKNMKKSARSSSIQQKASFDVFAIKNIKVID